jgi:hypothetical protein
MLLAGSTAQSQVVVKSVIRPLLVGFTERVPEQLRESAMPKLEVVVPIVGFKLEQVAITEQQEVVVKELP